MKNQDAYSACQTPSSMESNEYVGCNYGSSFGELALDWVKPEISQNSDSSPAKTATKGRTDAARRRVRGWLLAQILRKKNLSDLISDGNYKIGTLKECSEQNKRTDLMSLRGNSRN